MGAPVLDPAAVHFINHLLRDAAWAREDLAPFAGRTARIEAFPFALALSVLEGGQVALAATDAVPTVTARVTPGIALRLAARDESAWKEVEISGDADFAAAIHRVAHALRWDLEEDLSRLFGDVAAHRMAEAGRRLSRWGEQAVDNTVRSFAEYWTEEQRLIAGRRDLEDFYRAVDQARDDVARLEKRLDALEQRARRR